MQSSSEAASPVRPAHVPDALVRPYPFAGLERTTTADPRSFLPEVHKGPAVFWADGAHHLAAGAWIPRRFEDLQKINMDSEHFSPRGMSPYGALLGESWFLLPVEADPPVHALYRLALSPLLAASRIAVLDDKIRSYARTRMEALKPAGGCEFVTDFAFEFPIRVFLDLMGLPQEGMSQFLAWEHMILRSSNREEMTEATRSITEYLEAECESRRVNPKNDLLTLCVEAEIEGRKLTRDELTGFCFNLFVGGLDTVSTNMSSHFRYLAERPDQQRLLRAHPEKIPDAVEELMRAYAGVTTSRRCIVETQIGDVTVMPGDFVMLPTMLGSNDPEVFENPELIDFDRKPRHVSFGYGPHICIGIHLARRELRIAMEQALAVLPEFSLEPGAEITSYLAGIVGPRELPLVWAR